MKRTTLNRMTDTLAFTGFVFVIAQDSYCAISLHRAVEVSTAIALAMTQLSIQHRLRYGQSGA